MLPELALLQPDIPGGELDLHWVLGWGQGRGWLRLRLVRRRQGVGRLPVG